MSRKTAVRVTESAAIAEREGIENLAAKQVASDARKDAASTAQTGIDCGLMTLADWRAQRGQMSAYDLLKLARSAARLEMRGANYSADDRADCAAEIVRRVLLDTGGAMPRRESRKVTLTALCGEARNLRDSLDRQRRRDAADAERAAIDYSLSADAIGAAPDDTPAKHVAIVARYGEDAAERAVGAVLALLFPAPAGSIAARYPAADAARIAHLHPADSPVWLTLYQWVTGATSEQVGERRGMSRPLAAKRLAAGAKFLRGFYSAEDLASRLTLGASIAAGRLTYSMADLSREAPHKMAPDIAEHFRRDVCWREGTDNGRRADRPQDADSARAVCTLSRQNVRPKRERERAKGSGAYRLARQADALTSLARLHAQTARRRERAAASQSDLARGIVGSAA
jgi:hypothetical protein